MIFRKAQNTDREEIWEIIEFAIESRRKDGSTQWQDGYPNRKTISSDIEKGYGYVISDENELLIYAAIQTAPEPTYAEIDGAWLTNHPYVTIHRIAVSPKAKGKGMAKLLLRNVEKLALQSDFQSIRIDTHQDNQAMLHILEYLGYVYCGEIYVRCEPRKAFEKNLIKHAAH